MISELERQIILHLKRYDTAPLNCTASFMARKMGQEPRAVYESLQDLLSDGIVLVWEEFRKGVVTPYKIGNLPKLMEQGASFSYEDIELLTAPDGGCPRDTAGMRMGGRAAFSSQKGFRTFGTSRLATENLKSFSEGARYLCLTDLIEPKKTDDDQVYDLELEYLNTFFRSIFALQEIGPLYALYSSGKEDLAAFRERTVKQLLTLLERVSSALLDKMGKTKPPKEYVYLLASMLRRYADFAERLGIASDQTREIVRLKEQLVRKAGGAK